MAAAARDVATMPLGPRVAAWKRDYTAGPLSEEEAEAFFERGWVLKKGVIPTSEIEAAKASVAKTVGDVAEKLFKAGKIKDLCVDVPLEKRMTAIEEQFPSASVLLHKLGVLEPGIARLWSCESLLSIAEQLLGPSIAGMPVWNLRVKTPGQEQATVPWHQDCAYLSPEGHDALQVTAWIPLVPAREENGCMQVLDRGHRSGEEAEHTCCVGGTWYVAMAEGAAESIGCDEERDLVTVECDPGDVLLLNNLIPHRSLPNTSDGIRWSLDLRWQLPELPNGFYGLKENIVMRVPGVPDYVIDWSGWGDVDRLQLAAEAVKADKGVMAELEATVAGDDAAPAGDAGAESKASGAADDEFSTIIVGPWMKRWKMVNHNRHTDAFQAAEAAGGSGTSWH